MKVMEHFISRVLMEAGGLGLEEGGILHVGARGAGAEAHPSPRHYSLRGAAKPISTFIYLTIS